MWTELITNCALARKEPFTLSDVFVNAIGKEPKNWKRTDETKVIEVLESLGFHKPEKSTRVNGKSGKYYLPRLENSQLSSVTG